MGRLIWVGLLGFLALAVAWGMARYDLTDRVTQLEHGLGDIGMERGGHLPSEDDVRDRVLDRAEALGFEVTHLEVSVEPLSDDNIGRAGTATRLVSDKIKQVNTARELGVPGVKTEATDIADELGPRGMTVSGTLIEIDAQVRAKKWLWSVDEPVTAAITLH